MICASIPKLAGLTSSFLYTTQLHEKIYIFVINENQAKPYTTEKPMSDFHFYFGQSIWESGLI